MRVKREIRAKRGNAQKAKRPGRGKHMAIAGEVSPSTEGEEIAQPDMREQVPLKKTLI